MRRSPPRRCQRSPRRGRCFSAGRRSLSAAELGSVLLKQRKPDEVYAADPVPLVATPPHPAGCFRTQGSPGDATPVTGMQRHWLAAISPTAGAANSPPAGPAGLARQSGDVEIVAAGCLHEPILKCRGRLSAWTEQAQLLDGPLAFTEANEAGSCPFAREQVAGCVVLVNGGMGTSFLKQVLNAAAGGASGILIADNQVEELCQMVLPTWATKLVIPAAFIPMADGRALVRRSKQASGLRLAVAPIIVPAWRRREAPPRLAFAFADGGESGGQENTDPTPTGPSSCCSPAGMRTLPAARVMQRFAPDRLVSASP